MKRIQSAAMAAGMLLIGACGDMDLDDSDDRFDSMNLTAQELETAKALVAGFKQDTGLPILRSREYGRAACYARMVEMPDHLRSAHLAYLANYTKADEDYYAFFAPYGLGEEEAYQIYERYAAADEKCSASALVKKMFGE